MPLSPRKTSVISGETIGIDGEIRAKQRGGNLIELITVIEEPRHDPSVGHIPNRTRPGPRRYRQQAQAGWLGLDARTVDDRQLSGRLQRAGCAAT
ncbi:hypothetical protein ARTHRO9AX_10263 [Arthrobacter sp. 9AX]|nr:hypothetical protein ARTHRO9AX_10263 [Arthrobacter sp. 9AX]